MISTIVSQVTLFMTFGVWRVMSEVPANILANVVATVPSYYAQPQVGVGKSGRSHFWREVVPFWVLSFVGLGFSSLAVWLAGNFARSHQLGHGDHDGVGERGQPAFFAILWIVKFVIYNKLFHIDPVEYDEHHAEKRRRPTNRADATPGVVGGAALPFSPGSW